MKSKLKVGVFFGGKSPEHEISKISGGEVIKNLNKDKYQIVPVFISKDGQSWQVGENKKSLDSPARIQKLIDIAFIAMHGPFGEDGSIQGLLEIYGIPYTGSGVLASALGMDKIYSRKMFTQKGLLVPKTIVYKKGDKLPKGNFPLFIKPANQGSSVGTSKARNQKELINALKLALKYGDKALIEEFIEGIEITGGILANKPLPIVEIVPKKDFFDYEAKYDAKLTDEIVPARISAKLTKKAQKAALDAFNTIGCRAFGRVDMIIRGNDIYVLEVNTIPGLTPVSLLPKAAKAAGISYSQLLDKIIEHSK